MAAFISVVRRVVASDTSLLITGETGVGKERLARAIHAEGPRSAGPFIGVNCGALPETLLESELFGHEEGAFTGAHRTRRGWFELAHAGTIFLDEIGELPLHLQVKMLHVLQNHAVQRLGSERTLPVDVRVITATNQDLTAEMQAGRFRKDLYYRLSVVTLTIPPLNQRREDIPALVDNYINHFRAHIPHEVTGITPEALDAMVHYPWPGNVRELINVVERAMLLCQGEQITLEDLPETISRTPLVGSYAEPHSRLSRGAVPHDWLERPLREVRSEAVAGLEQAYLAAQLRATGGRIGETARRSGMEPRSVYEKMRLYGLRKEDYRPSKPK
jgi:DNA-binding NtrC family response regulator